MSPATPTMMIPASGELIKKTLLRKRAALEKICEAAKEYLLVEIDAQLEALDAPRPVLGPFPAFAGEKPDYAQMLVDCQGAIDRFQTQIDQLKEACDKIPEEMALIYKASVLPMVEEQLRSAEHHRDWIQKALEQGQADAGE